MKIASLVAFATLMLALQLSGCGGSEVERSDLTTQVVIATADKPDSLDPHTTQNGANVKLITQVFETLIRVDPNDTNVLIGDLAKDFEIAEDKLSLVFQIREGVKFHDGAILDAAACKKSLERVINDPESPYKKGYEPISEIIAEGNKLTVKLSKPIPRVMLRNLSAYPASIVSSKFLDALAKVDGEKRGKLMQNPAGTGPFKVASFQSASLRQRFTAFEEYWQGASKVKTLVFESVGDANKRLQRFKSGEIQMCDDITRSEWKSLGKKMYRWKAMNVGYLAVNALHESTKDIRVRRAIQLAVNRDDLVPLYYGTATPNYSMIPVTQAENDLSYRAPGLEKPLEERREMAKKLLEEAGATGRKLKLHFPQQDRPYLPQPQKIADKVRQQLEAIGLDVEIKQELNEVFFPDIKKHFGDKYELILIGWMTDNGDADNFYFELMGGEGPGKPFDNNVGRSYDKEAMDMILEAQTLVGEKERIELYRKIEKRLREHVISHIPLVTTEQGIAISDRLKGVEVDGLGHYRFHKAHLSAK